MSVYRSDHKRITRLHKSLQGTVRAKIRNTEDWTYVLPHLLQTIHTAGWENDQVFRRQELLVNANLLKPKQYSEKPWEKDEEGHTKEDVSSRPEDPRA